MPDNAPHNALRAAVSRAIANGAPVYVNIPAPAAKPRKADDLTNEAYQGYAAPAEASNPFLWSSPSHMAWTVGKWLRDTGRTMPRAVRMSRGYSIRANDMLISWNPKTGNCERIN